jgi:hypothetical protein
MLEMGKIQFKQNTLAGNMHLVTLDPNKVYDSWYFESGRPDALIGVSPI